MFDEKTCQQLKAYVYMLIDPRDNKPFYIGKGNNNRIFDHLQGAIKNENSKTLKYDLIRNINNSNCEPENIIIRHGLTDHEAYQLECGLIDTFEFMGYNLANIINGHNSIEKGLIDAENLIARYAAKMLNSIEDDCVIININKSYKRNAGSNAIYLATKEIWKMANPNGKIKYVLSEYNGLIVEVFEVKNWYTKNRKYGVNTKKATQSYLGYGFDGEIAPENIRKRYIYRTVKHIKSRGASNVIRYKW